MPPSPVRTDSAPDASGNGDTPGGGRLARIGIVVAIAGTLVGGSWTALQNETFASAVCPELEALPGHGAVCDARFETITQDEAALVIHTYLGSATASGHSRAWDLLSRDLKEGAYPGGAPQFEDRHRPVLWSELLAPPRAEDRNRYYVEFRQYSLGDPGGRDGDVSTYMTRVDVARAAGSGDIQIVDIEPPERIAGGYRTEYEWAYIPRAVDLHRLPRQNSTIAAPAKDLQPVDGRLRALCEIRVPPDSGTADGSDAGWWTRTNQGWIKNTDLRGEGQPLDIEPCSGFVLAL